MSTTDALIEYIFGACACEPDGKDCTLCVHKERAAEALRYAGGYGTSTKIAEYVNHCLEHGGAS